MKWMALVLAVWVSPLAHATTVEYVHTDGLGSVVALSNAAGQVIERREYEPYGHQLTPALTDGPGYTGHVQDAATGLTYMQQRYFDPSAGRFLSVDPVTAYDSGDMRHFNVYAYAFNSPYRFTDPDGQDPLEFFEGYIVGFGNEMAMRTLHDSYGGADSARQAGFEAGQVGGVVVGFLNPRGYIQQAGKNIFRRGPDVAGSASTASSVTRGARSLDDLSRAAGASDRGGLSAAGRALQKHGGRSGSVFPAARGNPAAINRQGQSIVDDILTTPGNTTVTRHHARFGNVTEIRAPDGRGVRYGERGEFLGFLEPRP
ncbi:MAG: RHS repeat-associated core domain-containing protein [Lysobacteraceae bacterium]